MAGSTLAPSVHAQLELALRMLHGELDPYLESGTFEEAILWGGASGRRAEIVRMALERNNWPRDDREGSGCSGSRCWASDLHEAQQAGSRATSRLILELCDPNLRAPESGQTMLHEVIARDHDGEHRDQAVMREAIAGTLERLSSIELAQFLLMNGMQGGPFHPLAALLDLESFEDYSAGGPWHSSRIHPRSRRSARRLPSSRC